MKISSPPSYTNSKTLSDKDGFNPTITTNVPVRGVLFTSKSINETVKGQAPIIVTNLDGVTSMIQTSPTDPSISNLFKKLIFIPLSIRNLQQSADINTVTNFTVFS